MSPSPGLMRKTGLTFIVGLTLGFVGTYIFINTSQTRRTLPVENSVLYGHSGFIPKDPHSHGEMDNVAGPEKEQSWNDFDADNHQEKDSLAEELKKTVRILCWVMTSPDNIKSKAIHVKATWGKRCNKLLFMSSKPDSSLPAIGLDIQEGRDFLWGKTKAAFKYVYKHHYDDADWFLKADDDTYVIMENLRHLLKDFDPSDPVYLGHRFKPYVRQGYMSGGAGYVLGKESLRMFVEDALPDGEKCRYDAGGAEDMEIGVCMQNIGVVPADTRDSMGRERFLPFLPEHHLIPNLIPKDNWYWEYNYYPGKEGPDCCSDYAITFHYVPPNMMYVFEYLVYHLKPFGTSTKLVRTDGKQTMPGHTVLGKNEGESQNLSGKVTQPQPEISNDLTHSDTHEKDLMVKVFDSDTENKESLPTKPHKAKKKQKIVLKRKKEVESNEVNKNVI